jgi:hypothetical protein
MRTLLAIALCCSAAPTVALAQDGDSRPGQSSMGATGGAQLMQRARAQARRPLASQFDSLGVAPLGAVGDQVTIYYFPDGANLAQRRHARISRRQRLIPPNSWRLACDDLAHPGWLFSLDAPATSAFGIVVPGRRELPLRRDPPPASRAGAAVAFGRWADSTWQDWLGSMPPKTERQTAYLRNLFFGDAEDAGWHRVPLFGVKGPGGRRLAAFSVWLYDDRDDGSHNTTGTWLIDGWGNVVARAPGKVDIYGVSDPDGDGIDDVITSRGVIHWDGSAWQFPVIYSEEPCLMHRVMSPPPGRRN